MSIFSRIRTAEAVPSDLMSYADGSLHGRRRRAIEAHLRACVPCRRFVEQLEQTRALLAAVERPPMTDALRRDLRATYARWQRVT